MHNERLCMDDPQPQQYDGDTMSSVNPTFELRGVVDDAALEEARSLIGVPLRVEQWNTEATIDNIRHYALGLGDLNPLWHDIDYARSGPHGTVVAPPTFGYGIYSGLSPGLGGLHALNRAVHWRFSDWFRLGDRIRAGAHVRGAELVESKSGRRRILQEGRLEYFRIEPSGEETTVSYCDQFVARVPPSDTSDGLQFSPREEYRYTGDELERIEAAVLSVRQRGGEPRYWEDVVPGDSVDQVVKGPFTRLSMVCYYAGAPGSPGYRTFDAWWRNRHLARTNPEALPNTFDPSYFSGSGVTSMGHHDATVAAAMGMPGVYDNGNQRVGLMATALTNWMGDHGFLREYRHSLRRPVILGDTLFIEGHVVAKAEALEPNPPAGWDHGSAGSVSIELSARNQFDETVSSGEATVLLPRRESGTRSPR
jgi:acyl dehydratase